MKFKQIFVTTMIASAVALSGAAVAAGDTNVTPAQKSQIEGVVHSYLVQNPEVVVESLQAYQQKQMEQVKKPCKKRRKLRLSSLMHYLIMPATRLPEIPRAA